MYLEYINKLVGMFFFRIFANYDSSQTEGLPLSSRAIAMLLLSKFNMYDVPSMTLIATLKVMTMLAHASSSIP